MTDPLAPPVPAAPSPAKPPDAAAKKTASLYLAAQKLEANFLAEMLKSAGFGKPREHFGGGAGEDQFASFLVEAQADAIAKHGGIGLTEQLFKALKGRDDATR